MSLARTALRWAIATTYYPSLWISRALCTVGGWHWWDEVDATIIVGAVPSRADLVVLQGHGVRAVVNLCAEFTGHTAEMERLGLVQLHLPTLDYFAPSETDVIRGIEFLRDVAHRGQKAYLHCKAGRGRSATLAIAYVMAVRKMGLEEAFHFVKQARRQIDGRLQQRAVLVALESRCLAGEFSDRG